LAFGGSSDRSGDKQGGRDQGRMQLFGDARRPGSAGWMEWLSGHTGCSATGTVCLCGKPPGGTARCGGTGIVKPLGGERSGQSGRLIGLAFGVDLGTGRIGKLIKAASGSNRGCVWIGGLESRLRGVFGFTANGWNGPGGKAIRARRPSGQGAMTIEPLEQQAFGHGWSDASLATDLRI